MFVKVRVTQGAGKGGGGGLLRVEVVVCDGQLQGQGKE